jgi:hypothetical protein
MMIWGYPHDFGTLHIYIYTYDPHDYFLDISFHTCGYFIYSIIYIYYPIIAMTHTTGIVCSNVANAGQSPWPTDYDSNDYSIPITMAEVFFFGGYKD